jgi:hypothetical protein
MTLTDKYTWVATATCGDKISFQSSTPGPNPVGYDGSKWATNSNALKAWLDCPAALEDGSSASPTAKGILHMQGQELVNGRRYWCPVSPDRFGELRLIVRITLVMLTAPSCLSSVESVRAPCLTTCTPIPERCHRSLHG